LERETTPFADGNVSGKQGKEGKDLELKRKEVLGVQTLTERCMLSPSFSASSDVSTVSFTATCESLSNPILETECA
jgi:hypothetical protein